MAAPEIFSMESIAINSIVSNWDDGDGTAQRSTLQHYFLLCKDCVNCIFISLIVLLKLYFQRLEMVKYFKIIVNEIIVMVFDILLLKKTFLNDSLFYFCFMALIVFAFYRNGTASIVIIIILRNNCGMLVILFIIDVFCSASLIIYPPNTLLPTIKFDNTGAGFVEILV